MRDVGDICDYCEDKDCEDCYLGNPCIECRDYDREREVCLSDGG